MNPVLTLKPVFVGWITLAAQLPIQLFFTIWCGGFFGGMFHINPIVIGALAFVTIPAICWICKKYNYQNTVYKIFDDHMELEEGFLTVQQKLVRFKDVREVTLRKGILQRQAGLGSVYLATQATGASNVNPFSSLGMSSAAGSGFIIRDIENSDQLYTQLKSLVEVQN